MKKGSSIYPKARYIYIYLDPRKPGYFKYECEQIVLEFEYEPFYVGQGQGSRYTRHMNQSNLSATGGNQIKVRKLRHIVIAGFNPLDYVVFPLAGLSLEESNSIEVAIIKTIGRIDTNTGVLVNLTDGGDGMTGNKSPLKGKTYEEIHGREIAQKLKEQKRDRFLGDKNPAYGKESYWKGKHLTEEMKQMLREKRGVSVIQLSIDGEFIKQWNSITEAGRGIGVSPTSIGNCLAGRADTAAGHKWRYANG